MSKFEETFATSSISSSASISASRCFASLPSTFTVLLGIRAISAVWTAIFLAFSRSAIWCSCPAGPVIKKMSPSRALSAAPASSAASMTVSSSARVASTVIWALRSNIHATEFVAPRLPPRHWKTWRISATVRLGLSVVASMRRAAPPGPYASYVTSSYVTPSSSPVPFFTARSMLSSGMFSALAASMAVRNRALPAGSPPPCLAAIVISRISLVNSAPRRWSVTAFFRLICFHLLWPAMGNPVARYTLHVPRRGTFVQRVTWNLQRRSKLQRSPVRVEHVLEPHPAPIEIQIHEPRRSVAVLENDQLGCPVHSVSRVVHLFPVDPEHHVGVLLDGAEVPEVVERGPRVRAFGVEPRQLRHHDEGHPALERQRLEALQHQSQVFVLRRARHAPRRWDELQVVDHDEAELSQRIEPFRRRLEVRGRERQHAEREIAQPHGRAPNAGARLIVELGAAQLVHRRAAFDREGAFHQALLVHLAGKERYARPLLRRAQRQPQRERGLASPDVAAQDHQVAASQAPTQDAVDRGEPGGHRVPRDLARALLVHAVDHGLERRTLGKAAGGHDRLLCVYASVRLAYYRCMRAARAATVTASPASGPRTSRAGATSWDSTSAAAAGVAGSRWSRAAARARFRGPGRARLASRASSACNRRRWFLPDTGCGGSSASAERTMSHSANRPSRLGPRTASATNPIKRSSAGVARFTRRGAPPLPPPPRA